MCAATHYRIAAIAYMHLLYLKVQIHFNNSFSG